MTEYQKGDRVALVRCNDEYTRLTPGELGTVQRTDDVGTIHVKWDSGASLGIIEDAGDRIRPAHEGFGLPYAQAGVDDLGPYSECPACGLRCRADSARTEDEATKGPAAAYSAHHEAVHA